MVVALARQFWPRSVSPSGTATFNCFDVVGQFWSHHARSLRSTLTVNWSLKLRSGSGMRPTQSISISNQRAAPAYSSAKSSGVK
jgi:hypothetical protein